jgi:hypothetical protein
MQNLNTAELQNAGWFDNAANWVKGAVHKVEGVVHKYQGQACGAAAKLNPSLAKACNGAANALEKADGALNKKLMMEQLMMMPQGNPFMNLAEEPSWIDIDPEVLVDEENSQVIAPVTLADGSIVHMAVDYDPEEFDQMSEIEQLISWNSIGKGIKKAAGKVGSAAKTVYNKAKPIVHTAAKLSKKYSGVVCGAAGVINPLAGTGCSVAAKGIQVADHFMNGKKKMLQELYLAQQMQMGGLY